MKAEKTGDDQRVERGNGGVQVPDAAAVRGPIPDLMLTLLVETRGFSRRQLRR
jgi:hypothetical protein